MPRHSSDAIRSVNEGGPAARPQVERANQPRQRAWRTLAPVWATKDGQALSPAFVERLRPRDRHTDRNTDAEYAFYRLSSRFQRYAEEYLFADERILAFAPWSATATDTWRQRFGRLIALGGRIPLEGALVVTDRQIFMIRDAAEVAGGSLAWGYVVEATTPERLTDVHADVDPRGRTRLHLGLRGAGGAEAMTWTFPPGAQQEVEQMAILLAGFLPRRDDRRLRRVGRILPLGRLMLQLSEPASRPAGEASLVSEEERSALEAHLEGHLAAHPDPCGARRHVHATAIVPRDTGAPELLAVTQDALIRVRPNDRSVVQCLPLSPVTSVELRGSVLGWHIAWTSPSSSGEAETTSVPFPIIGAGDCRAVFAALRQALTLLPIEAAGPELSNDGDEQPIAIANGGPEHGQDRRRVSGADVLLGGRHLASPANVGRGARNVAS